MNFHVHSIHSSHRFIRFWVCFLLLLVGEGLAAQGVAHRTSYEVKPKDTVFGIAKRYGLTLPELIKANPEMQREGYELKAGDILFIPLGSNADKHKTLSGKATTVTSLPKEKAIHIGVALPLHVNDGDGKRMIEFYRGMLMACDSLRREGISTVVHAWNLPIDGQVSTIIRNPEAAQCDAIFGPLYTTQVNGLAEFCKARNIRLIIPFSINGEAVTQYSQIFQVYQSPDKLNNESIDAFVQRFQGYHTVLIDCNDTTSRKGVFTFALRNRLTNLGRSYSITNLNNSEDFFARAFSNKQPNVVVLNTGRAPELTVAVSKLQSLMARRPQLQLSLFGYTEWLMYTRQHLDDFFQLDTYIPSTFFYNALDPRTQHLEQSYRQWFRQDMMRALPRFAIVGYDYAMFFIRGLHTQGRSFAGTRGQSSYRPLQTPLEFQQVGSAGMLNEAFQLVHYTPSGNIEAIQY